jgi:hypothetical protein
VVTLSRNERQAVFRVDAIYSQRIVIRVEQGEEPPATHRL